MQLSLLENVLNLSYLNREMEEEETEELSGTLDLQEINRMARGDDEDDDGATVVPEGEEGAEDAADDKTRISGDEDEEEDEEEDDDEEEEKKRLQERFALFPSPFVGRPRVAT